MVKKKTSTTKKTQSKENKNLESKKEITKTKTKIFPNVHFNLTVIVYLLAIIVLLMSGIVHFQTQSILFLDDKVNYYEQRHFEEYSYYSYTLEQFSRVSNQNITSKDDIVSYLVEQDFDVIDNSKKGLYALKNQTSCYEDRIKLEEVCRSLVLLYSEKTQIVELIVVRQ